MSAMGRAEKLLSVEPADAGRLVEALVAVGAASVGLRFARIEALAALSRRLLRRGEDEPPAPGGLPRPADAEPLRWAVDAAGNALGATCLPRSLALQWLLARRGVAADLCLGARKSGGPLPAHAWVEVSGEPLGAGPADPADPTAPLFEPFCRLPR